MAWLLRGSDQKGSGRDSGILRIFDPVVSWAPAGMILAVRRVVRWRVERPKIRALGCRGGHSERSCIGNGSQPRDWTGHRRIPWNLRVSVSLNYRSREADAEATREIIESNGGNAMLLPFDVSDRKATQGALSQDLAENGPYYGVVCNAGIHSDAPFPA